MLSRAVCRFGVRPPLHYDVTLADQLRDASSGMTIDQILRIAADHFACLESQREAEQVVGWHSDRSCDLRAECVAGGCVHGRSIQTNSCAAAGLLIQHGEVAMQPVS